MSDRTGISWTDATWNPIRGCSRVSQGCVHCYAETVAARFSKSGQAYEGLVDKNGRWNGKIRVVARHMDDPRRWRRPRRIFVNSMSDLFHENLEDDVIERVFFTMALSQRHTFQILTKRPERMRAFVSERLLAHQPLPNVWLGVSTEDQKTADERIPLLLKTPAAVRWISAEPLLGPIDLKKYVQRTPWYPIECEHGFDHCPRCDATADKALDWVVVGGESGPGHRPMDPQWAESIAAECSDAGVPLFVKQDSGSRPGNRGRIPEAIWRRKEFPGRPMVQA